MIKNYLVREVDELLLLPPLLPVDPPLFPPLDPPLDPFAPLDPLFDFPIDERAPEPRFSRSGASYSSEGSVEVRFASRKTRSDRGIERDVTLEGSNSRRALSRVIFMTAVVSCECRTTIIEQNQ